jgi:hypothetical protein
MLLGIKTSSQNYKLIAGFDIKLGIKASTPLYKITIWLLGLTWNFDQIK